MNKNLIGLNAGNAAIGWLAREDKIDFETEGGNDRLFLCVNVYIG